MWIVRDKNGNLFLFLNKPKKMESKEWNYGIGSDFMQLPSDLFSEIKCCENHKEFEPTEVELVIKK